MTEEVPPSALTDVNLRLLCHDDIDTVKQLCGDWFPIEYVPALGGSWDKWGTPVLLQLSVASGLFARAAAGWESSVHCGGVLLPVLQRTVVIRNFLHADFGRKMGFAVKGVDQLLEKD